MVDKDHTLSLRWIRVCQEPERWQYENPNILDNQGQPVIRGRVYKMDDGWSWVNWLRQEQSDSKRLEEAKACVQRR